MLQMLVTLSAPGERVDDMLDALRAVMRQARQARGCCHAGVYVSASDRRHIVYVEDWDDEAELRRQFGTVRFRHLLEVLELASGSPEVEFRVITAAGGLDYVREALPFVERESVS